MGQRSDFDDAPRRTPPPRSGALPTRSCLGVGSSPENAGLLLAVEDGFPRRFLWSPTIDRMRLKIGPLQSLRSMW